MPKAKILVNWEQHLIVHCMDAVGSDPYRQLIQLGYKEVGEIKDANPSKIFWDANFFRPQDKYITGTDYMEGEITT